MGKIIAPLFKLRSGAYGLADYATDAKTSALSQILTWAQRCDESHITTGRQTRIQWGMGGICSYRPRQIAKLIRVFFHGSIYLNPLSANGVESANRQLGKRNAFRPTDASSRTHIVCDDDGVR